MCRLSDGCFGVLLVRTASLRHTGTYSQTDCHQMQQWRLIRRDELGDRFTQSLSESGEEIERDDNERAVGLFVLIRVGFCLLILGESRVNDGKASLVDGLSVFGECSRGSDRDGRETLPVSIVQSSRDIPRAKGRDRHPGHLA